MSEEKDVETARTSLNLRPRMCTHVWPSGRDVADRVRSGFTLGVSRMKCAGRRLGDVGHDDWQPLLGYHWLTKDDDTGSIYSLQRAFSMPETDTVCEVEGEGNGLAGVVCGRAARTVLKGSVESAGNVSCELDG